MNALAETLRAAADHPERWDVNDLLRRAADAISNYELVVDGLEVEVADLTDAVEHRDNRISELQLQVQYRDDVIADGGVR